MVLFADQIPLHPALVSCSESERLSLALQGGDDYELLFTARAQARPQIEVLADRLGLSLCCIGEITADNRRQLLDARGLALDMVFRGYEHFAP